MLSHAQLQQARAIMSRPTTFGTVAAGLCIQMLGEESLDWDPSILDEELSNQLGADNVHSDVLQRIHAVSTVMSSREFFENPVIFHAVCATLLDPDNSPSEMAAPPEPLEMAWACAEVQLLLGKEEYSPRNFRPQVARYCGLCLEQAGVSFPPATLTFADFVSAYPDPDKYANETLLGAWTETQQRQTEQINSDVALLADQLRLQLLELRPFGGLEEQFNLLEKSVQVPEPAAS